MISSRILFHQNHTKTTTTENKTKTEGLIVSQRMEIDTRTIITPYHEAYAHNRPNTQKPNQVLGNETRSSWGAATRPGHQ